MCVKYTIYASGSQPAEGARRGGAEVLQVDLKLLTVIKGTLHFVWK